jgi:carboxymethylenebutenolidase
MILVESSVDLPTPSGAMHTYVYRPVASDRPWPGLVLFSEIFQRTGPIGRIAALLAGHGFVVAVPEVFHELEPPGTVIPYSDAARGNAHKLAKPISAFDDDARAVIAWLRAPDGGGARAVGSIGMCLGGHLAFRAGFEPDIKATVCFYATDLQAGTLGSGGDDSLRRAGDIKGELMMIWGRQDPHIPDDGRALIQRTLRDAKLTYTWHEWNAQHAFLRDEGPRYDPALAMTGLRMAIDLFTRSL